MLNCWAALWQQRLMASIQYQQQVQTPPGESAAADAHETGQSATRDICQSEDGQNSTGTGQSGRQSTAKVRLQEYRQERHEGEDRRRPNRTIAEKTRNDWSSTETTDICCVPQHAQGTVVSPIAYSREITFEFQINCKPNECWVTVPYCVSMYLTVSFCISRYLTVSCCFLLYLYVLSSVIFVLFW